MFIAVIIITFVALVASVVFGIFLGYPLLLSLGMFTFLSINKGYTFNETFKMIISGVKKALIVVPNFLLIGTLTASWLNAGTIPTMVTIGMGFLSPSMFIVSTFWLCCMMSMMLGSSFGSTSTMGVVLITIAKSCGVNLHITAAAVICGVYFGDRCSPMSTNLTLVTALSQTNFYKNVKTSTLSAIVPFLLSSGLFYICSVLNPMQGTSSGMIDEIYNQFAVGIVPLIPAFIIIAMCLMRINMKICIGVSVTAASIISVLVQGYGIGEVIYSVFMGFHLSPTSPISNLIGGGGMISMLSSSIVVLVSCCIAGIFDGTKLIDDIKGEYKPKNRSGRFLRTVVYAFLSAAIGCNQTISVVMTTELIKEDYKADGLGNEDVFIDVNVAASLLPITIPWNISVYVPMQMLGVTGLGYMPFLFFVYIFNIWMYLKYAYKDYKAFNKA